MESFKELVHIVGLTIDGLGVLVIVVGVCIAGLRFARSRPRGDEAAYRRLRQNLGRAILLGLELLVAGDIIRTVAVDPTLQNVSVLGLIVLIRTFLSMSIQVELEGRWPWSKPRPPAEA